MNYIIRKASKEDIPIIWQLGKNVSGFKTAEGIVTFWPESILEGCINKPDVMILVLEINQEVVGFTIANINLSLKKAELENMYVTSKYRHQGYGKAMLNYILDELVKLGIENVCGMASDSVEFLSRNGFTKGKEFFWMDLALSDRFKK